ncbi:chemotaxis protein CheA [Acuticoccus kandeliae]|uniref:chemotaxis protein CheA n=1 Tax=Acuticoccus kandeliae TaxID=2073160 RepID=UPI000D3E0564|nr:chemotaxis protein CheA [Acuticoccus kandeliae]
MQDTDPAAIFRQEATELVAAIEAGLLDLEKRTDDRALIDAVFRDLHTVKGSGAMFGHAEVAAFVHEFETAFDRIRRGEARVVPSVIAVSLKACDQILNLLTDPKEAVAKSEAILAELAATVGDGGAGTPSDGPSEGMRVTFHLPVDALRLGHNPALLLDELSALAPSSRVRALTEGIPPLDALDPTDCRMGFVVELHGAVDRAAVEGVFLFFDDGLSLAIEPLVEAAAAPSSDPDAAPAEAAPAAKAPAAAPAQGNTPDTMRVATERLDELMDRVGELVIAEARLSALAHQLREPHLMAVAEDIQRLAAGLRDSTMSMRMVPIGSITGRFRRLARDLSDRLGKPIRFETEGEETELDKTVIEILADPLVHIVRNAADHGLEGPDVRRAAGKAEAGTIRLTAEYSGAEVLIRVKDDGRGLDPRKIRARAVERGLIAEDSQLAEADLFRLVLAPGFSTAENVTDLSGRGVGMDVVKRTIDGLRGQIELASEPGHGTTVTLRLPLTLAIIDGLLVEIGGEHYTIPLAAVEECVELPDQFAAGTGSSSFLNIRGALVPFLRLRTLFSVDTPPVAFQKVVVVASGGARVGLVVDRIVANNQTVIKQLSRLHAGLDGFSGATILGDGTVALIVDVPQLVALGRAAGERRAAEGGRAERQWLDRAA